MRAVEDVVSVVVTDVGVTVEEVRLGDVDLDLLRRGVVGGLIACLAALQGVGVGGEGEEDGQYDDGGRMRGEGEKQDVSLVAQSFKSVRVRKGAEGRARRERYIAWTLYSYMRDIAPVRNRLAKQ